MPQGFFGYLNEALTKSAPYGAQAYENLQRRKANVEEKLAEQQKKLAEENRKTREYAKVTGLPVKIDEFGKASIDTPPEDYKFQENPEAFAQYGATMGSDYRSMYNNLVKENKPDLVGGLKYTYNEDSGIYDVFQMDRKSGQPVLIGTDANYNREIFNKTIRGIITLEDGTKVGRKGRDTQIKVYEKRDKTGHRQIETLDLGVAGGKSGKKPLSDVDYEAKISQYNDDVASVKLDMQKYLNGKFPNEEARDFYRQKINTKLDELGFKFMKMGSPVAQQTMLKLYKEGKDLMQGKTGVIGQTPTRQDFYKDKREEITQQWVDGEWGDRDATAILSFLETKFDLYQPLADSKADANSMDFDEILNNTKLEKQKE